MCGCSVTKKKEGERTYNNSSSRTKQQSSAGPAPFASCVTPHDRPFFFLRWNKLFLFLLFPWLNLRSLPSCITIKTQLPNLLMQLCVFVFFFFVLPLFNDSQMKSFISWPVSSLHRLITAVVKTKTHTHCHLSHRFRIFKLEKIFFFLLRLFLFENEKHRRWLKPKR